MSVRSDKSGVGFGAAAPVASAVWGGESTIAQYRVCVVERAGKRGNNHRTDVLSFMLWSRLKGKHQSHRNPEPAIKGKRKVTV